MLQLTGYSRTAVRLRKGRIYCLLLLPLLLASGCEEKNEALPATASDLIAYPGRYRVQLEFDAPAGAKSYKILYNNGSSVREEPVIGAAAHQSHMIENLKEGEHILRVITLNDAGAASTPKGVKVNVYGKNYQDSLAPRTLAGFATAADTLNLTFGPAAAGEADLWVLYTNTAGSRDSMHVDRAQITVSIPNINLNEPYTYYSVFKPEPNAIDAFRSPALNVKEEGLYNFLKPSWGITTAGDAAGYPVTNAIDGDDATVWRSNSGLPQTITVDMKSEKRIDGFYFQQAQTGTDRAKAFTFETSSDGNTWITQPSSNGNEFANSSESQPFYFAAPVTARYFRLTITSGYGESVAQVAEINLFNDRGSSGGRERIPLVNATQPFEGIPAGHWWADDPEYNNGELAKLKGWTHSNALISYSRRDDHTTSFICIWSHPPAGASASGTMDWTNNSKVYQTVILNPGKYELTFHFYDNQGGKAEVYGVATTGNTLPDYEAVAAGEAVLGSVQIPDTSPNTDYIISFDVKTKVPVTIGWVYNTVDVGHQLVNFRMSGIDLIKL
jgi:hypothetical protein